MSVEQRLAGKVVIITGASSGIGAATARALAQHGARLALAARSSDRLTVLAADLGAEQALAVPTDVTSGQQVVRLVEETVRHFGRVDALFANAGLYIAGSVAEGDPDEWARLIDVNVNGVLRAVHAVLPYLLAQGSGDILVNSSISGHQAIPWEPVYSASKHAVQAFVHGLRRQVAARGVRVGAIAPGKVANELWGIADPAEVDRLVAAHEALRSEDVAELVVYWLSLPPHLTVRDLVVLPQAQDL
jgi:ribitol 2-dehydrogenase